MATQTRRAVSRGKRHGFALVDVASGLLVIPTLILVVVLGSAREKARQAACQANLSAVGKASVMYSALSSDQYPFPMLWEKGDPNAAFSEKTVSDDLFGKALGTGAMQNVWPLLNENLLGIDAFHCPSDRMWVRREETKKYGWSSARQFSYGMHFPYDKDAAGKASDAKPSDPNANPSLVIFSDSNPGGAVSAQRPPSNHPGSGETILKRDSSVTFYKSTDNSKAGFGGDDIYTNSQGKAGGLPTDPKDDKLKGGDTSICPVPASQPASAPASKTAR